MPDEGLTLAARRVLVTGGSGFLGTHIVKHLVALGHRVVMLARSTSALNHLSHLSLTVLMGDVIDLRTMTAAVQEVDVVVYAAGVTSVSAGRGSARSFAVNVVGVKNVLDASEILGVHPRLVVIGTQSDNPGAYATTKREGELLALGSGQDVSVVRPSFVYGPDWRSVFGRLVSLVKKLPVIPIIGPGNTELAPIYVDDVAAGVARCLEHDAPREVHLSGPDHITYKQFLILVARALGRRPLIVPLPFGLVAPAVRVANKLWRRAPVSEDTILGLMQDRPYAPGEGARQIGLPLTSLEEGIQRTLQELH
jgi:NADH dehydrogenase